MATGIRKVPSAVGIPRTNSRESTTAAPPCTTTSSRTSSTTQSADSWRAFRAGLNKASPKKVGPLEVADRLEQYGTRTLEAIARARGHVEKGVKEFACTEMDLTAYGNLGVYYAEKLRGAAHLGRWMFGAGAQE